MYRHEQEEGAVVRIKPDICGVVPSHSHQPQVAPRRKPEGIQATEVQLYLSSLNRLRIDTNHPPNLVQSG
jgi:hypothetical protein